MASVSRSTDPVYDEVAAFLAALVAGGMRHIVLSPGSRSTPLTLCAAAQPDLTHWMQLDERTAAFFALGIAKATRSPVGLVCTSGTAAANYFPAIIEASRTGVPLLVLSADRPPELHGDWGANQTIDQDALFGRYPRLFHAMEVGGTTTPDETTAVAHTALAAMGSPSIGPVHINWPFRKPLEPVGDVPNVTFAPAEPAPHPAVSATAVGRLTELARQRGVLVVGPLDKPEWTAALAKFAEAAGWPILAESTSQLRLGSPSVNTVSASERFLLAPAIAAELIPEVVLFTGATPTGTSALQWADSHVAPKVLLVDPDSPWSDAGSVDAEVLELTANSLSAAANDLDSQIPGPHSGWLERWQRIDSMASTVIADATAGTVSGPAVVRSIARALPDGAQLLIANSMSVRDLDRYTAYRNGLRVHVSRGASGIDGQIATALGIAAATDDPVTLIIGDIAFLHDVGSVFAATRLGVQLTIVVINDDGGGIFSMLPIAARGHEVSFEELFHTPHGTDFETLDAMLEVSFRRIDGVSAIDALAFDWNPAPTGVTIIEVLVDHESNVALRAGIDNELRTLRL